MIDVIHVDEATALATTRALSTFLKPDDELLLRWVRTCRSFGVSVYLDSGKWVFTRGV